MIQAVKFIFVLILFSVFNNSSIAQVKFCAVGDILLDRGVRKIIEQNNVFYPFENIKDIISENDIAFYNNEFPFAQIYDGFPINKKYSFRAEPNFVEGLKYAGFNIASVANNHTIDYGKSGLLRTIEILNKNFIHTIGGGKNQTEAFTPLLIKKNGQTFAFFANLEFLLEGTSFIQDKPYPAFAQIERLSNQIRKYNSIVDFVIVSFHWGKENSIIPTSKQVEYAHKVIDAGADLVIGHHPHVLESIEIYRNKIILYSLGNFIFDNSHKLERQTTIFECKFIDGKIIEPKLIPISIENNRPQKANKKIRKEIFEHLKKISSQFNTNLKLKNKQIQIKYEYQKTVKELTFKDLKFNIYENKISVFDNNFLSIDYQMPDTNYIFLDACLFEQENVVYIYSIIKNNKTEKSRIAIFPFDLQKYQFLTPSLDKHDNFYPWKIDLLDVNNDSNPEIILGVHKSTRYYKDIENRIFVFNRDKSYIYPKWLGSKINNVLVDFKVNCNLNKLIILEKAKNNSTRKAFECKWNGFGFDIEKFLFEVDNNKDTDIFFNFSEYNFETVYNSYAYSDL